MKAIKLSVSVFVLMVLLASLTALPAAAQSKSKWVIGPVCAILALAKDDLLVIVAPPEFTGCNSSTTSEGEWLENQWPDVNLFAFWVDVDPTAATWTARFMFTPSGRGNSSWVSDSWIRVFRLEEGDLETLRADPCAFYNSGKHIAEGPGRWNMHSPDDSLSGPGTNPWGWVLEGNLDDNGYCPAGESPRLFWLQNWVTQSNDYLTAETTAQQGPTLTCK
jgi:hypothetical protein